MRLWQVVLLAAVALTVGVTLTAAVAQASAPDGQRTFLPLVSAAGSPAAGEIHGTIASGGAPAAGVSLTLWLWNGASWEDVGRVETESDGSYSFSAPAGLSAGQKYEVVYGPNDIDAERVYSWTGPTIEAYAGGTRQPGGSFDIANVTLLAPPSEATVSLPATLSWQRRGLPGETYQAILFDFAAGGETTFDEEGNSGSATITALPAWAAFGAQYGWSVWVCAAGQGCGDSFRYHTITLTDPGGAGAMGRTHGSSGPPRWVQQPEALVGIEKRLARIEETVSSR